MYEQRNNKCKWQRKCLAIPALLGVIGMSPGTWAESVHLGDSVPNKQQIIDLLTAPPPIKTRSARKPAGPNAVSLEVFFGFDSANLTNRAVAQLTPVGEALQSEELARIHFILEGHTDATGDENYNLSLSERRANAVKAFFTDEFSISADRLVSLGRGEHELLDVDQPRAAKNRRVKIIAN